MLQPLGARVLVKRLEAEDKSSGGIILPEAAQERPREGKSSRSAPASLTTTASRWDDVEEGDIVIYASYGGTEIKIDGEEYLIINEDDILAVRE
jgi:chaperonin GroES